MRLGIGCVRTSSSRADTVVILFNTRAISWVPTVVTAFHFIFRRAYFAYCKQGYYLKRQSNTACCNE